MDIAVAGRQGERRRPRDQHADHRFRQPHRPGGQRHSAAAGRPHRRDRRRDRQNRLVRDRSRHLRVQIGAEHPCHRRCLPRRRHAQIRVLGECTGQGLRGRDCHADIRRIARRAEADQYLLQSGGPRLRHLGRRRLPAEERACWPTSKAPAASARRMRHANSARAKPTMRNPGSRRLRRKSLARRAHRISGPILAGALLAAARLRRPRKSLRSYAVVGDAIPEPLTDARGDVARGRALVVERSSTCILCHSGPFPEQKFQGDLAPDLSGSGSRWSEGQLRLRLVDAPRLNAATIMPSYYRVEGLHRVGTPWRGKPILSAEQIEDIVAYLVTLRE